MRTQIMKDWQVDAVANLLENTGDVLQSDYSGCINLGGCGIWALHFTNLLERFGYTSKVREVRSDVNSRVYIDNPKWSCKHLVVDLTDNEQLNVDCGGMTEFDGLSRVPRTFLKYSLTRDSWNPAFVRGGRAVLDLKEFQGNPLKNEMAAREVLSSHMRERMEELYVPELKKILWR